ncbi:MAG: HRDC domain-containing protein, partial [Bacteroidales bacterium]|nr:HRDC domain-containing protein [Bacteroidales bacterium]
HKLGLQPWIIFGDPSLEDMTILYPFSIEDLQKCQGVGEGKARKFGAPFIDLIRRYVEENEITRPDDFVVKSAPTKSENKIFIIKSVDRRMSFEDIASARDMEMEDLVSEMESIVATGTKLNIDYEIRETLDDEVVDEIYDYFKNEAESDSVEDAIKALGADYDDLEIRLVRIKFLCEIAS